MINVDSTIIIFYYSILIRDLILLNSTHKTECAAFTEIQTKYHVYQQPGKQ